MTLRNPVPWLLRARAEGFAVAGFAAYNMETVQAVVEAADELKAPVLIQTTGSNLRNAGVAFLEALAKTAADAADVPVALHLDHGQSLEEALLCLRYGYTSVMIDASDRPFEENVRLTGRVVEAAHAVGAAVEAELGRVGGADSGAGEAEAQYTDPVQAAEFVGRTGVDSLAVAVGTAHGVYRDRPRLDFPRLSAIAAAVPVPLVLHGASGVPGEDLREAVRRGIAKFNIATELKMPFAAAFRTYFAEHPEDSDPRRFLSFAKAAYKAAVSEKIHLSGSAGKA